MVAVKIRHKEQKYRTAPTPEILKSLTIDINSYITICIEALKNEAILADPFMIVNGKGFNSDSVAISIVDSIMSEMISKDDSGFVASIYIFENKDTLKNKWIEISSNMRVLLNSAQGKVYIMKDGIARAYKFSAASALEFWNWLVANFIKLKNKVVSWYRGRNGLVNNLQAANDIGTDLYG